MNANATTGQIVKRPFFKRSFEKSNSGLTFGSGGGDFPLGFHGKLGTLWCFSQLSESDQFFKGMRFLKILLFYQKIARVF